MNYLKNHNFIRLLDLTTIQLNELLILSKSLKIAKKQGIEVKKLKGKNIALIFEKDSTRTRCSFEVAAYDQGAHVTYLGNIGSQIGKKESIKDTARVLGNIYDAILYRGFHQFTIETLAKYANIPVWNGLTDKFHPMQILADLLTMQEYSENKNMSEIKIAFIGNASNNIANSMLEGAALMGLDLRLITKEKYYPEKKLISQFKNVAKKTNAKLLITENLKKGVKDVDFIYTDVWVSLGETEKVWEERIYLLKDYQVNMNVLELTNNINVKFMHCLPSFHDNETIIGKKISNKYGFKNGIEVTDDVFESKYSIVFKQAENKLHTTKAIMITSLG